MSVPGEAIGGGDNTADIAKRIAERRASGSAPKPEGPPPDGLRDDDDYRPTQNVHSDDDGNDEDSPTPESLRRQALGEDESTPGEEDDSPAIDDEAEDLEASGDVEDDETDADESGDQDVLQFESVDELAELLGMEVDDFLSKVKVGTNVDGDLSEITLAELKKGHQLESSYTRKNQAFVEQKKQFEQELETKRAEIADHFAMSTQTLNLAQQTLNADFQAIDWGHLERENPAEWTKKRQQFGERQAQLKAMMQQTTAALQQAREKQKADEAAAREANLDAQHRMLMAAVPEWKDEQRASKDGAKVAEYLTTIGYTPDELENLEDHRLILLGRAALGMTGPKKARLALAKKKVDMVSNLVKPGNASKRAQQGKAAFTKKAEAAKATLAKTGTTEAAANAILARRQARIASAKRGRKSRV